MSATTTKRKLPEGIRARHSRSCTSRSGGSCTCKPTFEAYVYSATDQRKIGKTFPTLAAAKLWRADAVGKLNRGTLRAPTPTTVNEAADALVAGMKSGVVRNRSGELYKPSVIRLYETSLKLHIKPEFGRVKLGELRRRHVQLLVDRMVAAGVDAGTIRNRLMPLRVIYRRAMQDDLLHDSPTERLRIPASTAVRDRIASPAEAAAFIAPLARRDQALWGTAFYAGLRMGELKALRWEQVDLAANTIEVVAAIDAWGNRIEPKSKAGRRRVPIFAVLRSVLLEHRLATGGRGLVFGSTSETHFTDTAVRRRTRLAWSKADKKRKAETPDIPEIGVITLHEARHSFASLCIAAGVNAKAISTYMGHASITTTFDRYGHLMPGNEDEAAGRVASYLDSLGQAASVGQS
jgi:integrase